MSPRSLKRVVAGLLGGLALAAQAAPAWTPPLWLSGGQTPGTLLSFDGPAFDTAGRAALNLLQVSGSQPELSSLHVLRWDPVPQAWQDLGAVHDCPAGMRLGWHSAITADAVGHLTVVFGCTVNNGTSTPPFELRVRRYVDAWTVAETVAQRDAATDFSAWLASDAAGRAVLVYAFDTGLASRVFDPVTATWGPAVTLLGAELALVPSLRASADGTQLVLAAAPTIRLSNRFHRGKLAAWRYASASGNWGPMEVLPRSQPVDLFSCDINGETPVTVTNAGTIDVFGNYCVVGSDAPDQRLMAWHFDGRRWRAPIELAATTEYAATIAAYGAATVDSFGRSIAGAELRGGAVSAFVLAADGSVAREVVGMIPATSPAYELFVESFGFDGDVVLLWPGLQGAVLRQADGRLAPLVSPPPPAAQDHSRLTRSPDGTLLWLSIARLDGQDGLIASWLRP